MGKLLQEKKRKQYLEVDVRTVGSSVYIMDQFGGRGQDKISYNQLVLNHALYMRIFGQKYVVSFYISKFVPEDYPVAEQKPLTSTTFTELRQLSKELVDFKNSDPSQKPHSSVYNPVLKTIRYFSKQDGVESGKILSIKKPLLFCAQNSLNLRGYGDRWEFGVQIYEGTKYGETTDYYVTHIKVDPR